MSDYRGPHTKAAAKPFHAQVQCPTHNKPMTVCDTSYGFRHDCDVPGCTMVCWDGPTTTPADQDTRSKRAEAHRMFDVMWRGKGSGKRAALYARLAKELGIQDDKCHIGMFDSAMCDKVIQVSKRWHKQMSRMSRRGQG